MGCQEGGLPLVLSAMEAYTYQKTLLDIWTEGVRAYKAGGREADSFFDDETVSSLASIGLKPIEVYDFVEDFCERGEPDFSTFLMVSEARRDYFLTEQSGERSTHEISMDALPPKSEALDGIEWLPRLIPKAEAKLKGEMPRDLMYCCGGDRKFFKENNIHPAEFLRVAWAYMGKPEKISEWVRERRG